MGVKLKGEDILRVLAAANEEAKDQGDSLAESAALVVWAERIESLQRQQTPKTYLAIMGILLTARSLYGPELLDVRDIKASASVKGYSASSIGARLAAFAKEQGIDLRATSTQPMNNQPFTYKDRISDDMGAQAKHAAAWQGLVAIADEVNVLSPAEATQVLALLFHKSRRVETSTSLHLRLAQGKKTLDDVASVVAQFVSDRSDNGKVGQAFIAAVLDLIYGPENVLLGDTQDPDATTPGDVQVQDETGVWLWAEAKQKVIVTGDVTGFLRKVSGAGGERVAYFALKNSSYSGNIQPAAIRREAERLGIGIHLVESPTAALEWLLPIAPGAYATVAAALINRIHERMAESRCEPETMSLFEDMSRRFERLTD